MPALTSPISPIEAPVYSIPPRSRFIVDDVEYFFKATTAVGHDVVCADDRKSTRSFTHEYFDRLLRDGRIIIDEGYYSDAKAELGIKRSRKAFDQLPTEKQNYVLFKEAWCKRFIRLQYEDRTVRRSNPKLEAAIQRIQSDIDYEERIQIEAQAKHEAALNGTQYRRQRGAKALPSQTAAPSPSQLRRWVKCFERAEFDRDALVDNYNGPGKRDVLEPESYALHHKHALNFASIRPTKALLFEQLQKDLDDLDNERAKNSLPKVRRLKRRAFEMMIDRLDPFFVSVGRDGPDAALRKWAMLSTGLDVEKPFERLEIDEWLVSLMTIMVDAGVWEMLDDKQKAAVRRARVWISVAIDARTRMIVAMRFLEKAPNAESALATIELAMRDKSRLASHVGASHTYIHSKPRGIAMDNATNFTATEVMAKIVRLGISNINPPAGLAEMRARIERMFGTLKTKIAGYFTGQTFSNIIEKGDYDPKTNSSLNVEELTHGFLRGVLDIYHNSPHEGLLNETPYDCMRRLSKQYGLPLPPNQDVLRHVMGISDERRIGDHGIRFLGIRYNSKYLQRYRRDVKQLPVQIAIDRFDLSAISVKTDKGWITCRARLRGLEGVNIWRWEQAVRELRQRNFKLAAEARHLVVSGVRNLSELSEAAVRRAELSDTVPDRRKFDYLEKTLFRPFDFADDGSWGDELENDSAQHVPQDGSQRSGEASPHSASPPPPDAPTSAPIAKLPASDADQGLYYQHNDDPYNAGFGSDDDWTSD